MLNLVKGLLLSAVAGTAFGGPLDSPFVATQHGLLRQGRPFFWLGDTGWVLMRLKPEDVRHYLDDRAAKHFTVIQVMAIRTDPIKTSPTYDDAIPNYAGSLPFSSLDPVALDESYWQHIDFIIDAAQVRGLTVALATMWGRDADSLFPRALKNNERYGRLLGRRYRDRDNVIWLVTGEYEKINDNWNQDKQVISDEQRRLLRAVAQGLEDGHEGRHLMTIHPVSVSSDDFHDDAWLDFNMQQTWGHARANVGRIAADYRRRPYKPVLNGEPGYENRAEEPTSSAWKCRYEGYWSVFSGAFGYTYGANRIWQFHLDWHDALQYEGAADMQHLRFLMESRPMSNRIPDQSVLASESGDLHDGPSYCAATRASDGCFVMVYSTLGQPFTIDLASLSASRLHAWWYSPRDGRCYSEQSEHTDRPYELTNTRGKRAFTPPASGFNQDWVLVLDDATRGFGKPGHPHLPKQTTLPDINDLPSHPVQLPLMKAIGGTSVRTLSDWETQRKPELVRAMQHYTYGYLPPSYPIRATVTKARDDAFAGLASYREIRIDIPLPGGHTETIHLALFIPKSEGTGTSSKKPVVIYLSGQPNHMSTTYDQVTVRTYGGRFPSTRGTWQANYVANIEYPLTRGYALAHFCTEDLDPDTDNDTEDGLYRLLGEYVPGPFEHRLRQQMSWAWGVHRIVDYLETREDIDNRRLAVNGFSRRGRAASVASALDERIDLCWNHAGGGTHSWRDGEVYDAGYMYWFNEYHLKFIGREDLVPFDGNALIALHAPRPFLDTGGAHPGIPGESYATYDCHDHASAYGEMLSADTIYRLYRGVQGIVGSAHGSTVPCRYGGKIYQVVDPRKGHFQDAEFWKHGLDFMDVQFYGRCADPYSTYVYEAEDAVMSGCRTSDAKIHCYGSGYVSGLDAEGDWVEFPAVRPGAGDHYVGMRAACEGLSNPHQIELRVNGVTVSNGHELACWTDEQWFMDFRLKAGFTEGDNTVRITKLNAGSLNIDRIVIYRCNSGALEDNSRSSGPNTSP